MASLIDTRLYCPQNWASDPKRYETAAIPKEAQCYQTKSSLVLAMLDVALQWGLRFGHAGVDKAYGKEPAFLRNIDRFGCRFVADLHCDQRLFLHDPNPNLPTWKGRGKRPKHPKVI